MGVAYADAQGHGWYAAGTDIDGEVGHRLSVSGPTLHCPPSGDWAAHNEVISGSLPSGLKLNDDWTISGIPTERGHWVVTMKVSNIMCSGQPYSGYTQELRFHISGTGKVIQ